MPKRKNKPSAVSPGTMVEQKTFQDFNNRKPSLSDPNEIESNENIENTNTKGKNKYKLSDKYSTKPVSTTINKRTKRVQKQFN